MNFLELHPICLPVGLPVSVSYQPSSVGIFGMVFGIKVVLQRCNAAQIVYEAPILGVYSHLFYINIIYDHTEIVTDFSSNIG
jgi:hypothetical protein